MAPPREIAARLARWQESRDAVDLWPGVAPAALAAARTELARVTSAVLADAPDPVVLVLPPGTDVRALGVAAFTSGMGPLLGFWCARGRIAAQPPVAELLARHLEHCRERSAMLRAELERLLAAFAERGIDVAVLKGMHTAYGYFPDPAARPMSDIDLLIERRHAAAARAVLVERGFREDISEGQARTHWLPPGDHVVHSLELTHRDNPWHVDLHVSLDRRFLPGTSAGFGSPEVTGLERRPELPGRARGLGQPLLLAYLAFHESSHFRIMLLIRLVELVLVARRDFGARPEAWSPFLALLQRTRTERFIHPALELAERLAPGTIDGAVRARVADATPLLLRHIVGRTTPASAPPRYHWPVVSSLQWAATPREVLAFIAEFVWPSPRDGRTRAQIQGARLRRALWRALGSVRRR